jgi:hypothetical protein
MKKMPRTISSRRAGEGAFCMEAEMLSDRMSRRNTGLLPLLVTRHLSAFRSA